MRKTILAAALSAIIIFSAAAGFSVEKPSGIFVNGTPTETDAFIADGVTYVPLRAVSEMLGAEVAWNEETSEISISGGDSYERAVSRAAPSTVAIVGSVRSGTPSAYAEGIAHGTGVIVSPSGEIITNAHVVKDMTEMIVILSGGDGYRGTVSYADDALDLALVKIEKTGLPAAEFADDSAIVPGRKVVAIGTPVSMALRNSVSAGIISGMNRGAGSDYKLIQTDAAINPGNSGGPLVDLGGRVVGICSSGYVGTGIEGLSFAIPASSVKYALEHFRNYGRIMRPGFGAALEESAAARYGLPGSEGLTFGNVVPGGAAANAGIVSGDLLKAVDGTAVNTISDWNELSKKYLPGSAAVLSIERGGSAADVNIIFEEK